MSQRTWLITGANGGFGRQLAEQILARGDRVLGTVRDAAKVADLVERYPEAFHAERLDVSDTAAIRDVVERSFARLGRIDVIISNAGYGLFGAAEELSDAQIDHMIATNLVGSIQLIRAVPPHLRAQGGGRIIQISTYGGQVTFAGNSLYHATKWGIEGFAESVAQEIAPFGIGMTIVEPGGARTAFRYGSAQVAKLTPTYDNNPAHDFLRMLDPENGLVPATPPEWRRVSSRASTRSPRRCAWCSARRRWRARLRRCASGSKALKPRPSSPLPPTSRPGRDWRQRRDIHEVCL
jgi:NAD(P)-dependent dehydrogenase (short-subunit alcohol dehydrogenase family)